MHGAQAGGLFLLFRSYGPPFRPFCLSVSLREGGPSCSHPSPPPPRPVPTALSRLLGSGAGGGAAADVVTSRGASPGLPPGSALVHAPNSGLLAFAHTASDHSLVPWGGVLLTITRLGILSRSPLQGGTLLQCPPL